MRTRTKGARRGWWPRDRDALALLESAANCERFEEHAGTEFEWFIDGFPTSHANAMATARFRLALGYTDMTTVLTSDLFAVLVQRVVDLERDVPP